MPAYDGTIKIDSSIDTKGFNQGVKGLLDSVKNLAANVSSFFGNIGDKFRSIKAGAIDASGGVNTLSSRISGLIRTMLIVSGVVAAAAGAFLLLRRNAVTGATGFDVLRAKLANIGASVKAGLIPTLKSAGSTLINVVKSPQFFQYAKLGVGAFVALKAASINAGKGMTQLKSSTGGVGGALSNIRGIVLRLVSALGVFFGLQQLFTFGKDAVAEASKMSSALIGLQSVVEGTGNSFSVAQGFITDYIKDGLVPAGDAITAYKNLLLRGYNTDQIEKTLKALKDSAAFGRSGQLTIGEAVKSASEGLKNENSILVDNAGVSKNVSVIWKEYADSIGTTVAALTKEQKIQAEVNGIMQETKFQTGDAAKLANTYAGQVSALGVSFTNLKVAIGNAIIPVIQQILPYIRAAIDYLVKFFNQLATVVSIFFGVDMQANAKATEALASSTENAAGAEEQLAANTTEATKAAKGALAAFDQLNVLQNDIGDNAAANAPTTPTLALPEIDTTGTDKSLEALKTKVEDFKRKALELLGPAIEAFGRLKEALAPLGKIIIDGLGWAWENILVPFGKWAINSFLPVFIDLLAAGFRVLTKIIERLAPAFGWLWENVLKPLASWAADFILKAIKGWIIIFDKLGAWLDSHPDLFANIIESAKKLWEDIKGIFDNIVQFIANAFVGIQATVAPILTFIALGLAKPIQQAFEIALNWIHDKFVMVFTSMQDFAKSSINRIIDFINGLISGIASGFNSISGVAALAGIPVPSFTAPQIPRLATGAVIPPNSQFAAILGDQRSGKNIEAPEALLRQLISEQLGNIQADISIKFEGTMASLVRQMNPHIERERVRVGRNIVTGSVKTK